MERLSVSERNELWDRYEAGESQRSISRRSGVPFVAWQLRNLTRLAALSGLANAGYALARVPVLVFNSVQAAGTHGTHTLARCIGSDRGVPCGGDRKEHIAGFESR